MGDLVERNAVMNSIIAEYNRKSDRDGLKLAWIEKAVNEVPSTLEQEPCDDVCEWFAQYVDIATDIVEIRFSDGTVKRAKRGLYMRDIEKSIRKMLIDQMANEKKQEPKWIPVSERLPEVGSEVLVCYDFKGKRSVYIADFYGDGEFHGYDDEYLTTEGRKYRKAVAWMHLPEPYKANPTEAETDNKCQECKKDWTKCTRCPVMMKWVVEMQNEASPAGAESEEV